MQNNIAIRHRNAFRLFLLGTSSTTTATTTTTGATTGATTRVTVEDERRMKNMAATLMAKERYRMFIIQMFLKDCRNDSSEDITTTTTSAAAATTTKSDDHDRNRNRHREMLINLGRTASCLVNNGKISKNDVPLHGKSAGKYWNALTAGSGLPPLPLDLHHDIVDDDAVAAAAVSEEDSTNMNHNDENCYSNENSHQHNSYDAEDEEEEEDDDDDDERNLILALSLPSYLHHFVEESRKYNHQYVLRNNHNNGNDDDFNSGSARKRARFISDNSNNRSYNDFQEDTNLQGDDNNYYNESLYSEYSEDDDDTNPKRNQKSAPAILGYVFAAANFGYDYYHTYRENDHVERNEEILGNNNNDGWMCESSLKAGEVAFLLDTMEHSMIQKKKSMVSLSKIETVEIMMDNVDVGSRIIVNILLSNG